MKTLKRLIKASLLFVMLAVLAISAVACSGGRENLKGVTEDTIYVGNTAATVGDYAKVGVPFNIGIKAAFAAYNKAGGFKNTQKVELKTYNDNSTATESVTLMEKLLFEDEVFAIVGNVGANCVEANLDVIKEAKAPMVYAAAGNNALFNEKATGADRGIFPVQPLNNTEGRMMIQRAFASVENGGFAAQKVGVIYGTDEASTAAYAGIQAETANISGASDKIVPQQVSDTNYGNAVNALKEANCDVVIVTVTLSNWEATLKAIGTAKYNVKVITSYNNASATGFNGETAIKDEFVDAFTYAEVYALGWIDITSPYIGGYVYESDRALFQYYNTLYGGALTGVGVPGFSEDYWTFAADIYDYCLSVDTLSAYAFAYTLDAYAMAGYIAGDLFCQGLKALEESEKELTRANYIDIMESKEFKVCMADSISYANGKRAGVEVFGVSQLAVGADGKVAAASKFGLASLEDFRG